LYPYHNLLMVVLAVAAPLRLLQKLIYWLRSWASTLKPTGVVNGNRGLGDFRIPPQRNLRPLTDSHSITKSMHVNQREVAMNRHRCVSSFVRCLEVSCLKTPRARPRPRQWKTVSRRDSVLRLPITDYRYLRNCSLLYLISVISQLSLLTSSSVEHTTLQIFTGVVLIWPTNSCKTGV